MKNVKTNVSLRWAACAALLTAALPLAGCGSEGGSGATTDGIGGSTGAGGGSATGGSGTAGAHVDLGEGDGQDVITIGDSYMNLVITGIQQSLEKISGRTYRKYGFPGTLMLNEQIPNQYVQAVADDPDIKTVVMTGGGNDILGSSCTGTCQELVDQVAARLLTLRTEMAGDGVEDVIIVSYGYPADQGRHAALDYSRELLAGACKKDGPPPRCHYIDPVVELAGKILGDGIHPTPEGYDILGQKVWDLMQAEGVRR